MNVSDWRRKIDAIDTAMLHLLNLRAELAVEIGRMKAAEGAALRVPVTGAGNPGADEEPESGTVGGRFGGENFHADPEPVDPHAGAARVRKAAGAKAAASGSGRGRAETRGKRARS